MGDLHLKTVYKYYTNFSQTCNVGERHSTRLFCYDYSEVSRYWAIAEDYFKLELEELFVVPTLKKFKEGQNRVKKYQLVEAFISFLLQLLHSKIEELDVTRKCEDFEFQEELTRKCENRIEDLEKELRFLLTVLGDSSLLRYNKHEEFRDILTEFEAVANKAGSLVHSLLFSGDPAYSKVEEYFDVVLHHIHLLEMNIMKFLNILSSISRSACVTPKNYVLDSLLIVDSLIYDLGDLVNREDSPIADVKDLIKRLHQMLMGMQSSIKDIGSSQPSEIGELKEPLVRLGDMAHGAEYLIVSFLVGDAPLWYISPRLIYINNEIELIGTDLVEITKKYKSQGLKVAEYFSTQLSLQAKGNTEVDDFTVGFEDYTIDILDQLVGGTERLQVILIFGMPGLGKTTLAKKLYNHPIVNCWFDKLSWCVVSHTCLRKNILTNILIHIQSEHKEDWFLEMEEESLVEHIYKTLKRRRYLIVMDDIWTSNFCEDLQRCFPDDGNGSRILFTSRNKDVAPPNSIIYVLPFLSDNQCWELLEKKVFGSRPCPFELQEVGKKIAANCCGLPLAVVVIAGILSTTDKERSTWVEIGGNLASYVLDGGDNSSVMQILELSYKHLADYLKPCFLYFGAFEEDNEISARTLMRLWIAEGFISKKEEKSADKVAEEYLVELIHKSLVMVAKRRSDSGVKTCVIHDLLRDLCVKICKEENFLKIEKSNITLMPGKHETSPQSLRDSATWSYCQHIRSFHGNWLTSRLYVRDMRLVRILNSDYCFENLTGIEYLVNLRYLVISDDLLASVGGLANLEYLHVVTYDTVHLPPAIVKMRKLRFIRVLPSDAKYHKHCDSSQPNNLEYLSGIIIGELKDEEMLKCSPHLRILKCRCILRPMDKAYPYFYLDFLNQLDSLSLNLDLSVSNQHRLEEFRFPSNIRKLTLSGKFTVFRTEMSIIGRLKNLEVLKLSVIAFDLDRWDTKDGEFLKLRFLKLDGVDLIEWNVASSQHFPRLQQLILYNCHSLQEIPCEINEIPTLQLIEVKGICPESLVESAKRIQQEQRDLGNEEPRVIINTDL